MANMIIIQFRGFFQPMEKTVSRYQAPANPPNMEPKQSSKDRDSGFEQRKHSFSIAHFLRIVGEDSIISHTSVCFLNVLPL